MCLFTPYCLACTQLVRVPWCGRSYHNDRCRGKSDRKYESQEWGSCQIRQIAGCACAVLGTFSRPPRVSDPDMHQGTCVTHVPWCMPGSLTSGFLWNRWRGKRSRHSRCMRNPRFYVSSKRPMESVIMCIIRTTSKTLKQYDMLKWLPSSWNQL